ncbi:hypothetical protein L202_03962 [Cryptococcus amylolentus CBS 6039]|uniref:Uncharacterized protein n=1 Tax=Cryptococcus amylolentus CBS 6039 TaxID=1295533 RepID=A0A1E3HPN6_9TREE|nr:hypothetical protein L202_03962 [Cryptococcus amylolentus CBS 6039]ODN78319.1 hypothetical protein L202_03962 [Cryptococcus amylolentus CBS 6039]
MSSQVTSQVWPTSGHGSYDAESSTFPLDGIFEREAGGGPDEEEKKAHIWICSIIAEDTKNLYRGSFTSCANASTNSKAENTDYITRANAASTALCDFLKGTESGWGPKCRASGTMTPMREVEQMIFNELVESLPDQFSDIGLRTVDQEIMSKVLFGDSSEDSRRGVDSVAGMPLIAAGDADEEMKEGTAAAANEDDGTIDDVRQEEAEQTLNHVE